MTFLELVFTFLIVAVLAGLATYAYTSYRERAYLKLCQAQQRTLQKQIDSLGNINLDVPMEEILGQLVVAGSLQGTTSPDGKTAASLKLTDPGLGEGSYANYLLMPGSRMVGCDAHGSAFLDEP